VDEGHPERTLIEGDRAVEVRHGDTDVIDRSEHRG
jgi:hypothetical protein